MLLEGFHILIIISDIHLMDGICGKSISASAFSLFADRLRELAFNASWLIDSTYHPINEIDILLMGDILDPLYFNHWLEAEPDGPGYMRPTTDSNAPEYAARLKTITINILQRNAGAVGVLKGLPEVDGFSLPRATHSGQPDMDARQRAPVSVRFHYMRRNHDWYYHLPVPAFDLAINKPEEQKFVPCQVLTYLTFCKNGERPDRCFETWSGTFSD